MILRYIFSGLFLFVSWFGFSQSISTSTTTDSIRQPVKIPIDWKPSRIRFGGDVAALTSTLLDNNRSIGEAMAEMDLGNWFIVGEIGRESITRGESFTYTSTGNYWRLGADVNLIPSSLSRHVMSIGFRYGRSTYDESLSDFSNGINVINPTLNAGWIELTGGLRARVWKQLYLGYQLRLRGFKRISDEDTVLQTFDIPGFGRNKRTGTSVRTNAFGFNYYVYWTIPFRDKKVPPKKTL